MRTTQQHAVAGLVQRSVSGRSASRARERLARLVGDADPGEVETLVVEVVEAAFSAGLEVGRRDRREAEVDARIARARRHAASGEEILQLLFTANQDLRDLAPEARSPLVRSAEARVADALCIVRQDLAETRSEHGTVGALTAGSARGRTSAGPAPGHLARAA